MTPEVARETLLTRTDLANLLQVHPRSIYRLSIPSIQVGRCRRWTREAVAQWISEHTTTPNRRKR